MAGARAADILVAGAGPVGLTLAAELARHGVAVRIVDKSAAPSPFCRAIGVTPRSLEVLDDMGVARDLIDAGLWLGGTRVAIHGAPVRDVVPDLADLPYAPLGVPQYATEAVLSAHLGRFGVAVERATTLTGLELRDGGAEVRLDTPEGPEVATFRYVVSCEGAHSTVRRALGIAFEGDSFPMSFMLGDVHVDWDLPRGMALRAIRPVEGGPPDLFVAIPLPEHGRYRVTMLAPQSAAGPTSTDHGIQSDRPGATLADLQAVADRLAPGGAALSDLRWSSLFRISMRLAARYRLGPAFLAGDACHIHPPTGGQGMNTGLQDAYNLAWKLALVVRGRAAETLLDSYEAERRPVAADVVARTTEESLNFGRPRTPPHRLQDTQLLIHYRDGPLSRGAHVGIAAGMAGATVAAGDRVPEVQGLRRRGIGFALRLLDLLRGPQFVLLTAGPDGDAARAEAAAAVLRRRWPGLVRVVAVATATAPATQPVGVELVHDAAGGFAAAFGDAPGAAWLVRPDKHVGLFAAPWDEAAVVDYLRETIGLA